MSKQAKVNLSRRSFIARAGALTTGAIASGSVVAALAAPSVAQAEAPAVPWRIPWIDPDLVRNRGYWGYWADDLFRTTDPKKVQNYGCAYGTASALIAEIRRGLPAGSAWETLPLEMFKWGKTGCVESGTLCGALAGVLPIFTLVSPMYNVEMGTDLIRWYEETALPSREMDGIDSKRPYDNQPSSRSNSPLCHVSVSSWCKVSGQLAGSPQRKTRCGKLTGDVAKRAAQILNAYTNNGQYDPVSPTKYAQVYTSNPPEYADCVHCHLDAPPAPVGGVRLNNALGTSDCKTCHPDAAPVMSKK